MAVRGIFLKVVNKKFKLQNIIKREFEYIDITKKLQIHEILQFHTKRMEKQKWVRDKVMRERERE